MSAEKLDAVAGGKRDGKRYGTCDKCGRVFEIKELEEHKKVCK